MPDPSSEALASKAYLSLLLARKEREAADYAQSLTEGGMPLLDVYVDVLSPALAEALRRRAAGTATPGQVTFVMQALQRTLSRFAPALVALNPAEETAMCVAVGDADASALARLTAAALAADGFESYVVEADALGDLAGTAAGSDPRVLVVCTGEADRCEDAASIVQLVRASCGGRPFAIACGAFEALDASRRNRIRADAYAADAGAAYRLARHRSSKMEQKA